MRITFSTESAAEDAVEIWKRHGFTAKRSGAAVVTDCPTLWAVPVIKRTIGFDKVERLDILGAHGDERTFGQAPFGRDFAQPRQISSKP